MKGWRGLLSAPLLALQCTRKLLFATRGNFVVGEKCCEYTCLGEVALPQW